MTAAEDVVAEHQAQHGAYTNGDVACKCRKRFTDDWQWARHVVARLRIAGFSLTFEGELTRDDDYPIGSVQC